MSEYVDHVATMRPSEPALAQELAGFTGLSSVLAWMEARGLARSPVVIVGHDEFHYDFGIELPDRRWLVFGVT